MCYFVVGKLPVPPRPNFRQQATVVAHQLFISFSTSWILSSIINVARKDNYVLPPFHFKCSYDFLRSTLIVRLI